MSDLITQTQVISILEKIFGEGKLSNAGQNLSVVCPKCKKEKGRSYSKKKLVIRTDNLVCHCWVCGHKARTPASLVKTFFPGSFKEYLDNFSSGKKFLDIENLEEFSLGEGEISCTLPIGFKLLALEYNAKIPFIKKAKKYLASRGIVTMQELWYWKFGISEEDEDLKDRIILPSFNSEGKLNFWTARIFGRKGNPKYLNPELKRESVVFNEINIDWTKPLTITEGPFDLLKCNTNATCLLGSSLSEDYLLFRKIVENQTPVVMALDEDAKDKSISLIKKLLEYGIDVKFMDIPQTTGDVGAMTRKEFSNLYSTAIPVSHENFLSFKIKHLLNKDF